MDVKIYSLNINGLRSIEKQTHIKQFLKNTNLDILCLQETHIDTFYLAKTIEKYISQDFRYIWSFGRVHTCGVCFIVKNNNIKIETFQWTARADFLISIFHIWTVNLEFVIFMHL